MTVTLVRMCVYKRRKGPTDLFIRTVWLPLAADKTEVAKKYGGDKLTSLPTSETTKGMHYAFRECPIGMMQIELDRLNSNPACLLDPSQHRED